jgi:hypothetical protein
MSHIRPERSATPNEEVRTLDMVVATPRVKFEARAGRSSERLELEVRARSNRRTMDDEI